MTQPFKDSGEELTYMCCVTEASRFQELGDETLRRIRLGAEFDKIRDLFDPPGNLDTGMKWVSGFTVGAEKFVKTCERHAARRFFTHCSVLISCGENPLSAVFRTKRQCTQDFEKIWASRTKEADRI